MIEIAEITINITELLILGFKYGLIITGITGIFSIGIKYSVKLLSNLT